MSTIGFSQSNVSTPLGVRGVYYGSNSKQSGIIRHCNHRWVFPLILAMGCNFRCTHVAQIKSNPASAHNAGASYEHSGGVDFSTIY
jgi:hypothetical protein